MPPISAGGDMQPKSRGRPTKDPIEHLRVKLWYLAVKTRKPWSDYRLDQEFAWENDQNERKGADRLRVFETIRRRNVSPSSGRHPKRHFDLIAKVDAHPEFAGTARVYFSPVWELLNGKITDLEEIQQFVSEQLMRCGIHRPSSALNSINMASFSIFNTETAGGQFQDWDIPQIYEVSLRAAISELPFDLDLLALLGGLFREAYLVCALEIAIILKNLFWEVIDEFCMQQPGLSEIEREFRALMEREVMHWQMGPHFDVKGSSDTWPPLVVDRPLMKLNDAIKDIIAREDEIHARLVRNGLVRPKTKY